jgi:hypothetical protein
MKFKPAQRKRAKLRLAIAGPSGSGKTYSALLMASGMTSWTKIAVIDSENGSAELYAHLGEYSVLTLDAPYTPEKYIEAIHLAERQGFEVIIIDSLSHAWNGEGGILDQQGKATDTKYKGNSWAAWRECTPKHNALVEAMLKSSCHIIATMRSKIEYAQITENGKPAVKKLGMAPIQREGMEYEFTVFLDLSVEHIATPSKDRTGIFDGQYFKPSREIGLKLMSWLNCEPTHILPEVPQIISQAIPQSTIPQAIVPQVITDNPDVYHIINSEAKTKTNGQVFAKVVLLNNNERIVAWSAAPEILDLPSGTTITANLIEKNNTHLIESYSIVKGGEAA